MRLNLGCGKQIREGWHNVDKMSLPGVDQAIDLFHVPWPWESNSCEEIFASHLIEHIPHECRIRLPLRLASGEMVYPLDGERQFGPVSSEMLKWGRRLLDMDGFFAFFSECWRILKPGGTVECVAPYGQSRYALQDPTHCRSIVPATVNYLVEVSGEGANFDYDLPFRFAYPEEKKGVSVTYDGVTALIALSGYGEQFKGEIESRLDTLWNQAVELRFILRAIKE